MIVYDFDPNTSNMKKITTNRKKRTIENYALWCKVGEFDSHWNLNVNYLLIIQISILDNNFYLNKLAYKDDFSVPDWF